QGTIVGEVAVLRVGEPRGHLPGRHRSLDGFGPRARVLMTDQRHGRHLPRTMTALAVLLKNGEDVLEKRDRREWIGGPRNSDERQHGKNKAFHRLASLRPLYMRATVLEISKPCSAVRVRDADVGRHRIVHLTGRGPFATFVRGMPGVR